MGYCFSFSTNNTFVTVLGEAEIYNCSVSTVFSLDIVGRLFNCSLTAEKASVYSAPHSNFLLPLNIVKNGRALSADFEINRVKSAILPVNL